MKLEYIKKHYKNAYEFERKTGMSHNNWSNWEAKGYIPILTQLRVERLTRGLFKASIDDTTEGGE